MFLKEVDSINKSASSEVMCIKNNDLNVSRVCELGVSQSGKQARSITWDIHCRLAIKKKIMRKPKILWGEKYYLESVDGNF